MNSFSPSIAESTPATVISRSCPMAPKPPPAPANTPSAPGYPRINPPNSSEELPNTDAFNETTLSQITNVLEKLFGEVEQLKYSNSSENPPNNAPCDVTGSWNSGTINLRFDIHQATGMAEKVGLEVDIFELDPPSARPKYFIDCEFKGGRGEFVKKIGGPFYIMAYKSSESLLATFAGEYIYNYLTGVSLPAYNTLKIHHHPLKFRSIPWFYNSNFFFMVMLLLVMTIFYSISFHFTIPLPSLCPSAFLIFYLF